MARLRRASNDYSGPRLACGYASNDQSASARLRLPPRTIIQPSARLRSLERSIPASARHAATLDDQFSLARPAATLERSISALGSPALRLERSFSPRLAAARLERSFSPRLACGYASNDQFPRLACGYAPRTINSALGSPAAAPNDQFSPRASPAAAPRYYQPRRKRVGDVTDGLDAALVVDDDGHHVEAAGLLTQSLERR